MKKSSLALSLLCAAVLAAGCASQSTAPAKLKDGELAVPADYKSWPKFLSDIQRTDNGQVREIYVNPKGHATARGAAFPDGTIMVMELYKGVPGADGKLAKGDLLKVFVMGKNAGWGQDVPDAQKNGNWIYSAYKADAKTATGEDIAPCRTCHAPLTAKDFVHRYDEYFDKRAAK